VKLAWLTAAAACAVMAGSAFGSTDASTGKAPLTFAGSVALKPIKTRACSSSVRGKQTLLECLDTGNYRMLGMHFGATYRWRWTLAKGTPTVPEVGSFAINLGNGLLYLTMKGTARPIGKTTASKGAARTRGTWKYLRGTRAYVKRTGTGTYTFDVERTATKYVVLRLALKGTIR
jgi:hypothetical protein